MALRNVFYDMRYCCVIAVVILGGFGPKDWEEELISLSLYI